MLFCRCQISACKRQQKWSFWKSLDLLQMLRSSSGCMSRPTPSFSMPSKSKLQQIGEAARALCLCSCCGKMTSPHVSYDTQVQPSQRGIGGIWESDQCLVPVWQGRSHPCRHSLSGESHALGPSADSERTYLHGSGYTL